MEPQSVFSKFAELPTELRLKIWIEALPQPRLVPVRFSRVVNQYVSSERPSSLLGACIESRNVFLSNYKKLLLAPECDSAIFVDFSCDTIYFNTLDCSPTGKLHADLARSPHNKEIRNCAIDSNLWEVLRLFKYDALSEIKLMPNLKSFVLIFLKDELYYEGPMPVLQQTNSTNLNGRIEHFSWFVQKLKSEVNLDKKHHWATPPRVSMQIM